MLFLDRVLVWIVEAADEISPSKLEAYDREG
jgi:hypothetical protein